jgi:predicted O-linked N-acetylglucosamine transferase (SPINDLY family)
LQPFLDGFNGTSGAERPMSWLQRVLGRGRPSGPAHGPAGTADWLRAGYEAEYRGDPAGAEQLYRRVLTDDPANADAHYLLGRLADWDRRPEEAVALFRKAAELRPKEAIFLLALARALIDVSRFAEAVEIYRECVSLLPDCTTMQVDYAAALIGLDRREEARVELERLRERIPGTVEVHFNLGCIYQEHGGARESIASYRRALELRPDRATIWHNLLLELNYSDELDAAAIFEDHRRFGERFSRRSIAPAPDTAWPRRLRIGYVSPDFRNHVVMKFFEPILASSDRARFETYCYASHAQKDAVTARLRGLAAQWVDCEEWSDDQLADRIRADRIDVLVDLAGHTHGNRLLTFAMKPAPVQATYLGYPNTTGLSAVDYRITDAWADPPGESDRLNVERLVRLPGGFLCYRPEPDAPGVEALPAQASGRVTFGCFNNFMKLSPTFLDVAAQVLGAVPGSRLLLKGRPLAVAAIADSVRDRFLRNGIDPARLELRGWESNPGSHLALYGAVDIALDSFPYNGTTTTCEALWMGVPVVTLAGDRHAGRVGSSLLHAVGLADLVATDAAGYVEICRRLSGDLQRLAGLRAGLRERMQRSALRDEAGFARKLEDCYRQLWEGRARPGTEMPAPTGVADEARLARARQMRDVGRFTDAQALCESALREKPDHLEALTLLWDIAHERGAPGAAIDALNRAIAADGGVAAMHYMLGCVFQAQGKAPDAIASFRQALALDPAQAKTHNNLGCTLEATAELREAAECYRAAIRLDPRMAQAHYNLGNACRQLGDARSASLHIREALAIEPGHADWRCNLGDLHFVQRQLDDAIAEYRAAIEIDSGYVRAYAELGAALLRVGQVEGAHAAIATASGLAPDRPELGSLLLHALHFREDTDAPAIYREHLSWAERHARGLPRATAHVARPAAGRRLNIGYVRAAFDGDMFARLLGPVLAAHDRGAFNVFCYSAAGPADEVAERQRVKCEHWRDLSRSPDDEVADRVRADGIDILVDLTGHAGGGRPLLFARKAAPVQIAWPGYPDTSGLAAMDYRFTDAIADPEGATERFHTEELVRLPAGFTCFAPPAQSPDPGNPPLARAGHVTFGCFGELAAVTPRMLALWSEILRSLAGARLVLQAEGLGAESARRALHEWVLGQGIGLERIDLRAPGESYAARLAGYGDVDIALDVFPCNCTTQTCEALWMGVPVVSLAGTTHASRTGASILGHAGLAELVAATPDGYVEKAVALARDGERLAALRSGLRARLRSSALLDTQGFTRALERAYRDLWRRACGQT